MWQHAITSLAILDSPADIAVIVLVVVVLFGGKKIPEMMRGIGTGIREFKQGMRDEPNPAPTQTAAPTPAPPAETKK